ncbi:MAG: polysaccharide deacetylase family protein [Lachnospiraceae bacterium]|nr:polysaccharide deacetylase family protein [Lachnospiraceae bacterium]
MSGKNRSEDTTPEDTALLREAPEHDISEDKFRGAGGEKRQRRLRRYNIRMLIASVATLMALCAVLLVRIQNLNGTIGNMASQIARLTGIAARQQEELQLLRELTEDLSAALEEKLNDGRKDTTGENGGQAGDKSVETSSTAITAAHKVYLTFDDGPGANTQEILDILDRYGVKATFFVVGEQAEQEEELLKKIVEAGHTLGMHSYSHKYSELYASVESFAKDFAKMQNYLEDVTGVKSTVYRFPGGSSNTISEIEMEEFARYLDGQGVRFFDWNISSGDGGSHLVPAETLIENCTKNVSKHSTSVILMHDSAGKSTTLEALPTVIETIQAMEDTVLLPITEETTPVQHIKWQENE